MGPSRLGSIWTWVSLDRHGPESIRLDMEVSRLGLSLGRLVSSWVGQTRLDIGLGRLGLTKALVDLAQHGPGANSTMFGCLLNLGSSPLRLTWARLTRFDFCLG